MPDKAYRLLALLTTAPRRMVSVSVLCDMLWEGAPEETARANLRQLCKRIKSRTTGTDWIVSEDGYRRLADADVQSDVGEFLELTEPGAEHAGERLAGCWAGVLLQGCEDRGGREDSAFASWLLDTRRQLVARGLAAARLRIVGDHVSPEVRRWFGEFALRLEPTNEDAWKAVISAHLNDGDLASARRAFESCREILAREVEVEPSAETKALLSAPVAERRQSSGEPMVGRALGGVRKNAPIILVRVRQHPDPLKWSETRAAELSFAAEHLAAALASERTVRTLVEPLPVAFGVVASTFPHVDYVVDLSWTRIGRIAGRAFMPRADRPDAATVLWSFEIDRGAFEERVGWVAQNVLAEVETGQRDRGHSEDSPTAYHHYLCGLEEVHKADLASVRRGRREFRAALSIDSDYLPALSGLSRSYVIEWLLRGDPSNPLLKDGIAAAERCVDLDPRDFRGIHRLAHAKLYGRQFDEAMELFERAIQLNPHNPDLLADFADAQCHTMGLDEALSTLKVAYDKGGISRENRLWILASAYFFGGRYQLAVETFDKLATPNVALSCRAASWAMLGEKRIARSYSEKVMEWNPFFSVAWSVEMAPNRHAEQRERHEAGLRLAGLR
ncbi:tetratricopeptide repeat protein [Thalassobaculum sp.]|uniref:tetratricopeptide repeat protein n=1 Tax=Thalassobaculum sp. TaxID=2022740 RepID=UPI0032ED78B2